MASSQVEMVASSSPFGYVLRDRNRPNRCNRETSNTNSSRVATFQKNLQVLVRDHLHTCISISPDKNSLAQPNNESLDSITISSSKRNSPPKNETMNNFSSSCSSTRMSSRQVRNLDRWAAKQAEHMVSTIERQNKESELWVVASSNPCSSSNSKEVGNCVISSQNSIVESECSSKSQIGASSLVQIWEARLNQPKPNPQMSQHSRTSSVSSLDNFNLMEEPSRHSDVCDSISNNDWLTDWDSTAQTTTSSVNHRHSDVGSDKEKVRIADIIKRLTCDVHDHHDPGNGGSCDTPRRTSISSEPSFEHKGGWSLVVSSPRIRGRQAFHDLLLHIEHDRHKELGSLAERQAVSKFCYRGRIQSLLKLRFLRRDIGVQTRLVPVPPSCKPPQHSSSIMQLSSVEAWKERNLECEMEEEQEEGAGDDDQQEYFEEAPYDWFSDIARPRSYWEDMRRSWKTVSSFLSSGFRERIDRLMLSRARIQATQNELEADDNQEKMAQVAFSYFRKEINEGEENGVQEKQHEQAKNIGEKEETDEETKEEESEDEEEYMDQEEHQQESSTSRKLVEANDLFDQSSQSIFSNSPNRLWNYATRKEMDEYDQFSNSASQLPSQPFSKNTQDRRRCSCSKSRASIDVDVVNELRGSMEQLRTEVADLRKIIQSCMEMQMNLMRFIKHGVQPGFPKEKQWDMVVLDIEEAHFLCGVMVRRKWIPLLYREKILLRIP
ncbi:unnamed protein product [Linum tenue]|uniref:Uncharacterized protein n=1 Tax=Linum tenue TaxID=586396 RepID=A0AAV0QMV3_9ROSI|nr:unnamed protein product [Linum tenue]